MGSKRLEKQARAYALSRLNYLLKHQELLGWGISMIVPKLMPGGVYRKTKIASALQMMNPGGSVWLPLGSWWSLHYDTIQTWDDLNNVHLTAIAMALTMPEDMIDEEVLNGK